MSEKPSKSMFNKISHGIAAAAIATSTVLGSAQAASAKTHVSLNEYFSRTVQSGNPGVTHQNYSPYRTGQSMIDVTLRSSKHGAIRTQFNCETIIPFNNNGQTVMLLTEGAVSTIDNSLGARNAGDPAAVQTLMRIMANSLEIVTAQNRDAMSMLNHLNDVHGISPRVNIPPILEACENQLNR